MGTLRLEPGAHDSPDDGVCVVELASIRAGEDFSDRPACVDEVIAAFLRSWNDRLGHAERQRLIPYAERVVGTRGDREIRARRRDICLAWSGADLSRGPLGRTLARLRMRVRIAWLIGMRPALHLDEGAGEYAARLCFSRSGAEEAFALLDLLLFLGGDGEPRPDPETRKRVEDMLHADLVARGHLKQPRRLRH